MKHGFFLYSNELAWLCWQPASNPSLPANLGNAAANPAESREGAELSVPNILASQ